MNEGRLYKVLNGLFGLIWFINGFCCKVLNAVPRHQQIVARILGNEHSRSVTVVIGLAEIAMAAWIWSGMYRKQNTWVQIGAIGAMNILEFTLASDLLLWGKMNAVFAVLFILLIYTNEFGNPFYKRPTA
jgi:hypothetical protein